MAALAGAVAMVLRAPGFATYLMGALLIFEAVIYGSAPAASLAAEGIRLTPERAARKSSPQNTRDRPPVRRTAVIGSALA